MIKSDENKLHDVFHHKWPTTHSVVDESIMNEEIKFRTNMEEITQQIKCRRWKMIGHVLRQSASENTKISLTWTPEKRRRRGKLLETLRKTVEKEGGEFEFKG